MVGLRCLAGIVLCMYSYVSYCAMRVARRSKTIWHEHCRAATCGCVTEKGATHVVVVPYAHALVGIRRCWGVHIKTKDLMTGNGTQAKSYLVS